MDFSPEELQRYSRNLALPGVGRAGQARLRRAGVLVVGLGGLGSPAALYLAAAGIGRLGLVDSDRVELSNLQRQVLHDTAALGEGKVSSALRRLRALNPGVELAPHELRLEPAVAAELVRGYDFILDCSDNFATKFLVNDAAVLAGKPFCHAGALGFRGQVLTWRPEPPTPCLRCLIPEPPAPGDYPTAVEQGILGAVAGVLGALQAVEAIKVLAGVGEPLAGRLLTWDALSQRFSTVTVERNPDCPLCSVSPRLTALQE